MAIKDFNNVSVGDRVVILTNECSRWIWTIRKGTLQWKSDNFIRIKSKKPYGFLWRKKYRIFAIDHIDRIDVVHTHHKDW